MKAPMRISKRLFLNSIYSGVLMGIAASFHYTADNDVVGAFIFAIGVGAILVMNSPLYTGAVGNVVVMHRPGWLPFILVMLAGNIAGCALCALGISVLGNGHEFIEAARKTWEMRLDQNPGSTFVAACFCGILLYTSWRVNQKCKARPILSGLVIILCVMAMVLCRFDHSIADSFYLFMSGSFDLKSFLTLGLAILGNGVGAALPAWLYRTRPVPKKA